MKIEKIEWSNISSYGNKTECLDFTQNKGMWQLFGKSGSGKSSIIQMPQLLIYGMDSTGANKGDYANWINHNGVIKGTITSGGSTYVIERKFDPDGLSIWKNEEKLVFPTKKEADSYIVNIIMNGLPFDIYKNLLSLSLNNVGTSFVTISAGDKRKLIDSVFSMEAINSYSTMAKSDKKIVANDINFTNGQINALDVTIARTKASFEDKKSALQLSEEDASKESIIRDGIERMTQKVEGSTEDMKKVQGDINTEYVKRSSISNERTQRVSEANTCSGKIRLFHMNQCPTCGAPFNTEEIKNTLVSLEEELSNYNKDILELERQLQASDSNISELNQKMTELQKDINESAKKKDTLNGYLNMITAYRSAKASVDDLESSIKNLVDDREKESKKLEEQNNQYRLFEILEEIYSEGGVKKYMRERYIPTLNAELKDALEFFDFPYTLTFDNDFASHIKFRGEDINIKRISAGERKKVDMCVLCSLIRIIKRKYPEINMICLDETISSLDYESSVNILKYLKKTSDEMGLNIFVVSHTTLDESMFDYRLFIDKKEGFSTIEYV
jgi:DNA repair exonuclease SbcCD ATPase subunit